MTQAPRQYTALVTGGARGIGRAIFEELQASGVMEKGTTVRAARDKCRT
jgi:NAD(P)-dependent dehydrogenase (short-subunit alcohol dehydrogenase family)